MFLYLKFQGDPMSRQAEQDGATAFWRHHNYQQAQQWDT